jgi:hypothetical protein
MIFQTITGLTPGTTYSISGDYAFSDDFHDTSTNASFGVALDGVFMFEASKPAAPVWLSFNFPYTPASTSALLSLVAQRNGTTVGYGIDNIAITVPEPSAFCILVAAVFLGLNNSGTRRNRPSRGSS